MNRWIDEWLNGWMDEWMDGCMHACMHTYLHTHIHTPGYGYVMAFKRSHADKKMGRQLLLSNTGTTMMTKTKGPHCHTWSTHATRDDCLSCQMWTRATHGPSKHGQWWLTNRPMSHTCSQPGTYQVPGTWFKKHIPWQNMHLPTMYDKIHPL